MDKAAILAKIRKCMALSASANEHEAAAALRQARKLMETHGLTDTDVLAAEVGEETTTAGASKKPAYWESALAAKTGEAFGCKVIFRQEIFRVRPVSSWVFIGTGANFDVAKYCFEVLYRQVKRARADHIKAALKRCKTATKTRRADLYCEGWVSAAVGKLNALALGEREQSALDAYLSGHYTSLAKLDARDRNAGKTSLSDRDYRDYAAGRQSGAQARLNRGVREDAPLALEAGT